MDTSLLVQSISLLFLPKANVKKKNFCTVWPFFNLKWSEVFFGLVILERISVANSFGVEIVVDVLCFLMAILSIVYTISLFEMYQIKFIIFGIMKRAIKRQFCTEVFALVKYLFHGKFAQFVTLLCHIFYIKYITIENMNVIKTHTGATVITRYLLLFTFVYDITGKIKHMAVFTASAEKQTYIF